MSQSNVRDVFSARAADWIEEVHAERLILCNAMKQRRQQAAYSGCCRTEADVQLAALSHNRCVCVLSDEQRQMITIRDVVLDLLADAARKHMVDNVLICSFYETRTKPYTQHTKHTSTGRLHSWQRNQVVDERFGGHETNSQTVSVVVSNVPECRV